MSDTPENETDFNPPGPRRLLLIWSLVLIALLVAFVAMPKEYASPVAYIFVAFSAMVAALIAYSAARLKVLQEERHKSESYAIKCRARHIQARRVCRYIQGQLEELICYLHMESEINVDLAINWIDLFNPAPNAGLKDLLQHGDEIDPSVLSELHFLYESLATARTIHKFYSDGIKNETIKKDSLFRTLEGWQGGGASLLISSLRRAFEQCAVICSLCLEVNGQLYHPSDERREQLMTDGSKDFSIPAEIPQAPSTNNLTTSPAS